MGEHPGRAFQEKTAYHRYAMEEYELDWRSKPPIYKFYPHAPVVSLPSAAPDPDEEPAPDLWTCVARRRSVRAFGAVPLTLVDLSRLLWASAGVTTSFITPHGQDFYRAAPTAGALYPIETYVVVNRVEELVTGLYHYQVREGELVVLREGDFGRDLARAGLEQEMLEEAACVFAWTAMVGRSKWKYRERAYRYIYMDAGHVGQNFYLAAAALNLGCCTVGAFFDEEVDRLIGVDGTDEISVYLGAVGKIK